MSNVKNIISAHNRKTLGGGTNKENILKPCNCRKNDNCPLQGECRCQGVIYKATVTEEKKETKETYTGITANEFKLRYAQHNASLRHSSKRSETTLSKHCWALKDKGEKFNVTWNILQKSKAYEPGSKRCPLCLGEKYYILYNRNGASLNDRSEVSSSCRHKSKFLLSKG